MPFLKLARLFRRLLSARKPKGKPLEAGSATETTSIIDIRRTALDVAEVPLGEPEPWETEAQRATVAARPHRADDSRILNAVGAKPRVLSALRAVPRIRHDAHSSPARPTLVVEPSLQTALRLERLGRIDEAISTLETAVARRTSASLLNQLALLIARNRGDLARAEALLNQATELAPQNPVLAHNLRQIIERRALNAVNRC